MKSRQLGWLLSGGVAALALRAWGLPLPLPPCPVRQLTGVPCPTCYLTRSLLAALQGDWPVAWHWHPLGVPLLLAVLLLSGWLLLGRELRPSHWRLLLPVGAAALLLVWIIRLGQWFLGQPLPG